MAKKRVQAGRKRSTKKVKAPVRAKSKAAAKTKVAPRKAASKKKLASKKPASQRPASKRPTRKATPTAAKQKPAARKPSKSLSTAAPEVVERATPAPPEPEPQPFWDPKGGQSAFRGDSKAHTKPEDQRAHIRMTAPRTWSNRQPGRG